ncbi:MAG: thioredoxin [Ruminiclostridium sp.]|nr:thioredoxin [Ruminiclostridium sp.]
MATVKLSGENFRLEVTEAKVPVLVDFYAGWCTPCRMIMPLLEDISEELAGRAKIARVDVTEETELADKYRILNLPTMLIFRDGVVTDTLVGVSGKQQIMALLQ